MVPHPALAVSLGGGDTETMYTVVSMLRQQYNCVQRMLTHILSCVAIATGSAMGTVALGNHPDYGHT